MYWNMIVSASVTLAVACTSTGRGDDSNESRGPPDARPGFSRGLLCGTALGLDRAASEKVAARVLMTLRYDTPREDRETCSQLKAEGCTSKVEWAEVLACDDPGSGSQLILYTDVSEVHATGKAPFGITQPYFGHLVATVSRGDQPASAGDLGTPGTLDMLMRIEGRGFHFDLTLDRSGTGACPFDRFTLASIFKGTREAGAAGSVVGCPGSP